MQQLRSSTRCSCLCDRRGAARCARLSRSAIGGSPCSSSRRRRAWWGGSALGGPPYGAAFRAGYHISLPPRSPSLAPRHRGLAISREPTFRFISLPHLLHWAWLSRRLLAYVVPHLGRGSPPRGFPTQRPAVPQENRSPLPANVEKDSLRGMPPSRPTACASA